VKGHNAKKIVKEKGWGGETRGKRREQEIRAALGGSDWEKTRSASDQTVRTFIFRCQGGIRVKGKVGGKKKKQGGRGGMDAVSI